MANVTLRALDAAPITLWLQRWADGDQDSAAALAQAMLPLLRRVAVRLLGSAPAEGEGFTPTLLLNEIWLRLTPDAKRRFDNRRHFFGSAVRAMRFVLIDHLRSSERRLPSAADCGTSAPDPADVQRLDVIRALERLHARHGRQGEALLLAKVAGCTLEEVAEHLDISIATARRDLRFAEAFVKRILGNEEGGHHDGNHGP